MPKIGQKQDRSGSPEGASGANSDSIRSSSQAKAESSVSGELQNVLKNWKEQIRDWLHRARKSLRDKMNSSSSGSDFTVQWTKGSGGKEDSIEIKKDQKNLDGDETFEDLSLAFDKKGEELESDIDDVSGRFEGFFDRSSLGSSFEDLRQEDSSSGSSFEEIEMGDFNSYPDKVEDDSV